VISPASPVADQPRAVASRSASDGAGGGAGRRPAKNADRPRNQSRGCNTVVTHLPGEAKSPSPWPRPELDAVSHPPQQLHRLPVGHRRRMFAQPPWTMPSPHHGWHQHQARQRPATVGTTLKPRQDVGTLRPQARLHPDSSDPSPIDADVDSCGISPCGSVRAPSAPSRGYGRQPGLANAIYLPSVQRVSGLSSWPPGVGVQTLRAKARAA
jgi:hypothetical protein